MADKDVGALKSKVALDTAEFKKGVTLLGTEMKIASQEFKNASAGLDKVADASKIAALKTVELSSKIDLQKKYVEEMRNKFKDLQGTYEAGSQKLLSYELSLKKAEGTLKSLETELKSNEAVLKKHGMTASEAGAKFKELGVTWESTGQKLQGIGKAMSVAITAPIIAGAGVGLKFNAQMEDFQANFETMLGSADKAKNMIAELTEFAKSTPFEMTGLADSAKVLLNFGMESRDVMKTIGMLGDVSMGNQEKLGRITLAFGQIQSTGRLMGQDLLQLINSGFNPLQVISEKTGRSMSDLKKDMEDGAISSDMVTQAFKDATSEGGMFFGAMDKGSKTMNGQMSTLKDTINITLGETMKPIFEDISKNILPKIIKGIEDLGKKFSSLSDTQKSNIVKWVGIAAAVGPVILVVGKLITIIPALVSGISALNVAFTFLAANPVILVLAATVAALGAIIYMSGQAKREIDDNTRALIDGYKKQADEQKKAIDAAHKAERDSLEDRIADENAASAKRQKIIQDEYEAETKAASKKEKDIKQGLDDRMKALDTSHKTTIDQINAEYGVFEEKNKSKLQMIQDEFNKKTSLISEMTQLSTEAANQEGEIFEKTYLAILAKAKEVHNEKIFLYEQEYLASIGIINSDLAAKIKGFQDEITGIKGKTEEENRILKEQDDAQKIIDLQKKVDEAKDDEEKKAASADLLAEINRQTREKLLEQRTIRIEELNKQIKAATEKASEEKNLLLVQLKEKLAGEQAEIKKDADIKIASGEKERKAKVDAETSKYNAAKKTLDDQIKAMDVWMPNYQKKLDDELKRKQALERAKLAATQDALNAELAALDKKIATEKRRLDEAALRLSTKAEYEALVQQKKDIESKIGFFISEDSTSMKNLDAEIAAKKKILHDFGVPGFAGGVTNFSGGLARVNEQGGEIRFLDRGTTVIPHDISMEIARVIGSISGGSGSGGLTINFTGTLVGSNGMEEFAQIISRKMAGQYGLATGGAY